MKNFCLYTLLLLIGMFAINGANAQTQTYYIPISSYVYEYGDCGGAGAYACTPGFQIGFNWNDVIPAGNAINSVTIQIIVGVECSPAAHAWSMNGVGQGSYTPNGNACSCSTVSNGVATLTASTANYVRGGANTFRMTTGSSCLGFYPGFSGGAYGVVTVNYGAPGPPCGWSGGSGWGPVTPPCNSFTTGSVGSGTYTFFNIEAGANYTISTCGSSFDTQLSIYVDYGAGWLYQAGNNDNGPDCSGTAASVNWTSSWTTSNAIAVVNRNNCQQHDFTGTSAVLSYKKNCCSPQSATTWNGNVSTDWFIDGNWSNCVPGTITNATIPAGMPRYPVIGAAAYVNTVTVNNGATITINAPGTLTPTQ